MARKVNSELIRIPKFTTWPSLWHTTQNYSNALLTDFIAKSYLKTELKRYGYTVFKFILKRTYNCVFISTYVYNFNKRSSKKFKNPLFKRYDNLMKAVLSVEIGRFSFVLFKLFGCLVFLNFKHIYRQKTSAEFILSLSNITLLATHFFRSYRRVGAGKKILTNFGKQFSTLSQLNPLIKGLKVRVTGPMRAPRQRRSQLLLRTFFGRIPIQTYNARINYIVKSKVFREGVVTAKFWMFKKLGVRRVLIAKTLKYFIKKVHRLYKKALRKTQKLDFFFQNQQESWPNFRFFA